MERVGGREEKMEGHCSTGQSPQWAVVPMEEEEEEEEGEEEEEEEEGGGGGGEEEGGGGGGGEEEEEECRPSSGCPKQLLGDYKICVVILGRGTRSRLTS